MFLEGFGYNGIFIPVSLVVLSIFLTGIFIKESIIERRILKFKLSFGALLIFSLLLICIFYTQITLNEKVFVVFEWLFVIYTILIGASFYFSINVSVDKKRIHDQYLKCIEKNYYFVYLDKKGRIKDLSKSFEVLFNVEKNDVRGHNFVDVLYEYFQVEYVNDTKVSSEDFKEALKDLSSVDREVKMEILGFASKTHQMLLNLTDRPLFTNDKFYGHVIYGNVRNESQISQTENELDFANDELEMIKLRFLANLDLSSEAIFSLNVVKGYIWGNDSFVNKLNLPSNSISFGDYVSFIHPDDQVVYKDTLNSLDQNNTDYELTYRFKTGQEYSYVKEKGRKLFRGDKVEIMGFIDTIRSKHYEKSNIKEIDDLQSMSELYSDSVVLCNQNKIFEVVTYRIANIPDINKKYGRDLANLVIADYIKAVLASFVDNNKVYRVSGLDFAFIVTDPRKMERLKRGLEQGAILNVSNDYGNYTINANVYMGIATSRTFTDTKMLIQSSQKALDFAVNPQIKNNYVYYDDFRKWE